MVNAPDMLEIRHAARNAAAEGRRERIIALARKTEAALRAADVYRGELADKPQAACEWYAMIYSTEAFRIAQEAAQ